MSVLDPAGLDGVHKVLDSLTATFDGTPHYQVTQNALRTCRITRQWPAAGHNTYRAVAAKAETRVAATRVATRAATKVVEAEAERGGAGGGEGRRLRQ